jgi:hypothetical protein
MPRASLHLPPVHVRARFQRASTAGSIGIPKPTIRRFALSNKLLVTNPPPFTDPAIGLGAVMLRRRDTIATARHCGEVLI